MSDTKIDDGGPAFPSGLDFNDIKPSAGMTLRDWFAGQALASLRVGSWAEVKDGARYCYDYADAMLAARKEKI